MNGSTAEWVRLSNNFVIVAHETGEAWLLNLDDYRACEDFLPFNDPMAGPGTRASTGALLDAAVAFGLAGNQGSMTPPELSLPRYVFDLVGAYHNARRTPGHYRQAAERFRNLGRDDLAAYLEQHAREETGHDRLVIKDLRALGLPADCLLAGLVPKGLQPVYDFFDRLCVSDYPIGCIGYSYCFESRAAMREQGEVERLEALCPPGIDASRFLRTHSGLGSEVAHVEDMVDFVAGLPSSDRTLIVQAAHDAATLMADSLHQHGLLSDATLLEMMGTGAGQPIRLPS
jgi:hypothetical protein